VNEMSSSGGNFTEFGELVLIIGDFHVPFKKADIPSVFKELLNTDKIKTVLCTGNVCSDEIVERLRGIANNVHIVKGDMDISLSTDLPESSIVQVGHFKVGLIHGHQIVPWANHESLEDRMRKMDVDILVSGHTHVNEIFQSCTGKYLINPGSVSGAQPDVLVTTPGPSDNPPPSPTPIVPSFMLMAVQGPSAAI
jgi:vacuolar protein sorting-associated protein 29